MVTGTSILITAVVGGLALIAIIFLLERLFNGQYGEIVLTISADNLPALEEELKKRLLIGFRIKVATHQTDNGQWQVTVVRSI